MSQDMKSPGMATNCLFKGWEQPLLPQAAKWLLQQHCHGDGTGDSGRVCDLSKVLVVVPARRAGRRLQELLAEAQPGCCVLPPRLVTLGELPEYLYEPGDDGKAAGVLDALLARVAALRGAEVDMLRTLLPHPPDADDVIGWCGLAEQLAALSDDLAAWRLRPVDVPRIAAQRGIDLRGEDRWHVLAALQEAYERELAALGLIDLQTARREALTRENCRYDGAIVLVGTVDLNAQIVAMLEQVVGQAAGQVVALVQAPSEHEAGFDAFGGLKVDYWERQRLDLADAALHVVDQPGDQAKQVAAILAEQHACEPLPADQITLGLGDEGEAERIARTLELAGAPARIAAGSPMQTAPVVTLLDALADYVSERRLDRFAALLRHPDLEKAIERDLPDVASRAKQHWLTLLDRYATQYLQVRLGGDWLGDGADQQVLRDVYHWVDKLINDPPQVRKPLGEWSVAILHMLEAIYGPRELKEYERQDHTTIATLRTAAEMLREHARLDRKAASTPYVTISQALRFAGMRMAAGNIPEPGGPPAIELVGYLELALDDAMRVIVTSLNEGAIPASHHADAFLTDSLRAALGMSDNRRRFARDLLLLQTIMHSRRDFACITCRRSEMGDPVSPSRLLFACDDQTLVRRVRRVFAHAEDAQQQARIPLLVTPGARDRFLIPPPVLEGQWLPERLNVTDFRLYLACPYRFYLQKILRLEPVSDGAVELNPLQFGTLAHKVLEAFGKDGPIESTSANAIAAFLRDRLDTFAGEQLGSDIRPAVRIQLHRLGERLEAFARMQADSVREGWKIDKVEFSDEAVIDVDGRAMWIKGKIDRIDVHDEFGYRILDYKTGDRKIKPDKAHLATVDGKEVWLELQLPLYLMLCRSHGLVGDSVRLGYVCLPKKLDEVGLEEANWSDVQLQSADETRDAVIRDIRNGVFWPPSGDIRLDDYSGLCGDNIADREELVKRSRAEGGEA